MRPPAVAALCLLVAVSVPSHLAAQTPWVPPQPPCEITPGFYRLNSVPVNLKIASQRPEQRDHLLAQSLDVLVRSIRDDHQERNPAAWYYLGRYYVETGDAAGADSAFTKAESLAPQCRQDIAGYRARLAADAYQKGMTAWQEGKEDSAVGLLRSAARVNPANPRPLYQLGSLFASRNDLDSATAYYRQAVQASATDTAFAEARRDALATIARIALRRTQGDPAVQRTQRLRQSRDSLAPAIANDSAVLDLMKQRAASRRARGARLSPADQRAFSGDSAAREQALARGRAARAALDQQAAADTAAVRAAYEPAISAYKDVATANPTSLDAALTLTGLYVQSGRQGDALPALDAFFAHAGDLEADTLFSLGQRLVQARLYAPGVKAYTLGLKKRPYDRDGLYNLAFAYVSTRDTANAIATGRRLLAIDPLSRAAIRIMAQAWQAAGRRDSAQKYQARSDSLAMDINVSSFVPDSGGYILTAIATNQRPTPSRPLRLTFEFLDAQGGVQATRVVDVASVSPGQSSEFQVRAAGQGITGWRYKQS
jgi:cytochrome c-type biogenesis protein CcmH/NrfG